MEHDIPAAIGPAPEWTEPAPQKAPAPTYAPFLLALGITMTFWGLATSPVMSVGGLVIFACAMGMWIRGITKAWRD